MNTPAKDITLQVSMMQRALVEAARGLGRTRPNPSVGCVIARGDRVIASAYTAPTGRPHAETRALKAAGEAARGAQVYITLEPCDHFGRTPPCTEALIQAGVERVWIGVRDPHPLVNGRGIRRLRQAGIAVEVGLLEGSCRRAHEAFLHYVQTRRPFIAAKIAQSLDGRVATRSGESQWITTKKARERGHELRNRYDAIAVGVGTVLADDPRLTCRSFGGRDPVRVVFDTEARTPPDAKLIRVDSEAPSWIFVGDDAPIERVQALEAAGAQVFRSGRRHGRLGIDGVLIRLGERDITSVLVEGGPRLLGGLNDAGLINKIHGFIAPRIIGGRCARASVEGEGIARLAETMTIDIVDHEWLDGDLAITGYPVHGTDGVSGLPR